LRGSWRPAACSARRERTEGNPVRRRSLLAGLAGFAAAPLAGGLAGCGTGQDPSARLWHQGELIIGTGNTTGVFYVLGAGYANVINKHLDGYDAAPAATGGSIDNLKRLTAGDVDIALTLAGAADDAYAGKGNWAGQPQPIRALARAYNNYEHVIARIDSGITTVAGMKGHRISLGSPGSGTELIGRRLIEQAGLDPAKDVTALSMSLPQTVAAMIDGSIDAMIWSGGLPTPGIVDLFGKAGGKVRFLPIQDLLNKIDQAYPNLLSRAVIPKAAYGLPDDVPAMSDANLIVVAAAMPADLAYQLTRLLFDYQNELVAVHPAASGITREAAPSTDPVPLHDGARRYYSGG
jgi:TRAP transporter TAXI family solute receptor